MPFLISLCWINKVILSYLNFLYHVLTSITNIYGYLTLPMWEFKIMLNVVVFKLVYMK